MKNTAVKAVIAAALGNMIWGFSFLFIRIALNVAPDPNVMLSHRFTLSTLIMLGMMVFGKGHLSFKGKNWRPVVLLLAMQLSYYLCESYALQFTNTTIAGLVLALVPVATIATGMLFLKEYPSLRQGLFCIMPVVGVSLMTVSGKELGVINWIGILLLLCTLLSSAFYKTASRKASQEFDPFERTFMVLAISAIFFTGMGIGAVKGNMRLFFSPFTDWRYVLAVLALSVFCSIVAGILTNYATGHMSVFKVASFGSLSTLCSTFAGVFILREFSGESLWKDPATWMLFLGGALIIVGIWQVTRQGKPKEETNE